MNRDDLIRLRKGDSNAHRECVAVVSQWARRQGMSRTEIEELAADVILEAFKGIESFRGESSLESWLVGIAGKRWASICRQRARRATLAPIVDGDPPEVASVFDVESAALDRLEAEEALGRLSEDERQAYLMRHASTLTTEQIARRLNRSSAAVTCLLYRAGKKMDAYLKEFES